MRRYDALRKSVDDKQRGIGHEHDADHHGDHEKRRGRNLDQWRGNWSRLTDLFTQASSGEKEDEKGDRSSGEALKPKSIDPNRNRRRKRSQDWER